MHMRQKALQRHRAFHAELGSIVRPFSGMDAAAKQATLGAITTGTYRGRRYTQVESWEALISQSGAKQRHSPQHWHTPLRTEPQSVEPDPACNTLHGPRSPGGPLRDMSTALTRGLCQSPGAPEASGG